MKKTTSIFAAMLLTSSAIANATAAEIKVGFIASLTGPGTAQGANFVLGAKTGVSTIPQANGHLIKLIVLDDASDPATAARNARKLIEEDKIDILIGSSSVPGSLAVAAVARERSTPHIVMAPINIAPKDRGWTFATVQPPPLEIDALLKHMKQAGIRKVGYMGFSDAWGDLFYSVLIKKAPSYNIEITSNERYARTDTSVTGQTLKVLATHPDAIVTGTAGTAGALPYLALTERGYQGPKYASSGLVNSEFVNIAGSSIEGLIAPTGPGMIAEQLTADNPIRAVAMRFRSAYEKTHGSQIKDAYAGLAFDSWLLLTNAASSISEKIQPGTPEYRIALRDAIADTKELIGVNGVYNFKPGEVFGMDDRGVVIVSLEKGAWKLQRP